MEKALWYLLTGTRGGANRARIVRLLDDQPRNANRLAAELGVDYNTVRHHLDMLVDHDVVEPGGDDYGKLYFLTDRFERHREAFERITDRMEPRDATDGVDTADTTE
ncbi:winged helix-turn-helix domain-containing protein [Halobaculum litoreum]|uniref:Winged helix-turn-helix domain-containing protein n=1 Tax=Halobaculum litoreum TaxID=3031998 RepID=A0ABD5XRL1_9EURY